MAARIPSPTLRLIAVLLLSFVECTLQAAITLPSECEDIASYAAILYQSTQLVPSLCATCGSFEVAFRSLVTCVHAYPITGDQAYTRVVFLNQPIAYCELNWNITAALPPDCGTSTSSNIDVAVSVSSYLSSCALYAQASTTSQNSNCSLYSEFFASSATTVTASPSSLLTTAYAPTTYASTTSSQSSSGTGISLSTGAIAGIAVGAALGGILIFSFVVFFIWRHRKQRRKQIAHNSANGEALSPPEKAQLHSDEYKLHREELQGSKADLKVRTIGGLNELEHSPLERTYSEMPANEPTGSELKGSNLSPTSDSSTLAGSGLRNEVSQD